MRQEHGSIFERLSKGLHARFDDVSRETLPERWIDLIRYLDEKERGERGSKLVTSDSPPWCGATRATAGGTAMIRASQIKEHMDVKGSDGKHVGTVLGVENGRLKLASGGMDHVMDIAMVDAIENDAVRLRKTAEETVRTWH